MRILLIGLQPKGNSCNTLAIGYLKTYADKFLARKADIRIFDSELGGKHREPLLKLIDSFQPDIIGFSCYLWNIEEIVSLCTQIGRKSRATIVLGGPEMNGDSAKALTRTGAAVAVTGEGEATFLELVERLQANAPLAGLAGALVRTKSGFVRGPVRELISNLDDIPSPYLAGLYDKFPNNLILLETLRGCLWDCAFCVWTQKKSKLRYFSLDRIRQEADWLKAHTHNALLFVIDSDSFDNRPRALMLLKCLGKMAEESQGRCCFQTKLINWDKTLMRAFNSPHLSIDVGVNSINSKALALANRPITVKTIEEKIIQFRKCAPQADLAIFLMYAMPGETFSDQCEVLDWAWRQNVGNRGFSHTIILPGSRYETIAKELGLKYRSHSPRMVISTKQCKAREIRLMGQLVFFICLWRGNPLISDKFKALAQKYFDNSHTKAMRAIYAFLPAEGKKIMEAAFANWEKENQYEGNAIQATTPYNWRGQDQQLLAKAVVQAMGLCLKNYLRSKPAGGQAVEEELGEILAWEGELRLLLKQYRRAIALLEKSGSRQAPCWLGAAYLETGNTGRAIEKLQNAVVCSPGDVEARLWLAEAYRRIGQNAKSLNELEFVEKMDKGNFWSLLGKAMVFADTGKTAKMERFFELAVKSWPELIEAAGGNMGPNGRGTKDTLLQVVKLCGGFRRTEKRLLPLVLQSFMKL